jgi:hypothetical protein
MCNYESKISKLILTHGEFDRKKIISLVGFQSKLTRSQTVQHHRRVEQDVDLRLHAEAAAQTAAHFRTGTTTMNI